jgi:two-component system chemotaxis response regulator CheB
MPTRRLVVIGASAGGVDALRVIAAGLPQDFPAPVCIVMHTAAESPGVLHEILARAGTLPAVQARDQQPLQAGRLYVAPPDRHLVIEPGRLRVTRGPRENRFRPAVDPLLRSAAQVYGPAAIGVVLTGNLDDGTAGLWAIKQLGGTAVVQDPADAEYPSMPESARRYVAVDHIAPLRAIPPLLVSLTAAPAAAAHVSTPLDVAIEVNIAKEQNAVDAGVETIGRPSSFACPECHGVLLQLEEGGRLRFRCHTGHAYSADSLRTAVNQGIEDALWNAVRALEEGGLLMQQLSHHLRGHADTGRARRFADQASAHHQESEQLRQFMDRRVAIETSQ